jgi:hypothetical protein
MISDDIVTLTKNIAVKKNYIMYVSLAPQASASSASYSQNSALPPMVGYIQILVIGVTQPISFPIALLDTSAKKYFNEVWGMEF